MAIVYPPGRGVAPLVPAQVFTINESESVSGVDTIIVSRIGPAAAAESSRTKTSRFSGLDRNPPKRACSRPVPAAFAKVTPGPLSPTDTIAVSTEDQYTWAATESPR